MNFLSDLQQHIDKAKSHLTEELAKIQTGRASTGLVDHIKIDSYGSLQPLKAVASVSIPEPQSISIQPWDKSMLQPIEKAIQMADLGLTPNNDGVSIRINIPPLSEERRKELCKLAKKLAEEAKVGVRTGRQAVIKSINATSSLSEDDVKGHEKKVQEKVDEANKALDDMYAAKEKEIMTI